MPRGPAVGRVAAVRRRVLVPRTAAALCAGRSRVLRPGYEAGSAPWETPSARRRDRVPVALEARDPTGGNVRCPRRPRRRASVQRRGAPAASSRGRPVSPPRSPPRDRIAARPPRRRGGSGNRGSSSMAPNSSGAGGKRRSGPAFDLGLFKILFLEAWKRSRGRWRRRGRGRSAAPATTTWFPAHEGVGCESFSEESPRALPPARVPRARLARGEDGFALQARSRWLEGGGWGNLVRWVRLGGRSGSNGSAGLPGLQRGSSGSTWRYSRSRWRSRSTIPLPLPFSFSIRIPVPPDCLGPGGQLGFKRAVRWLFQVGGRRFECGRFGGGAAGWSSTSCSSPNPSPKRRGISDRSRRPRTDRSGRSRSRSGRSRSRSRSRSSARGGAGSEGGNASLGGSGLDRRRSSRSRPRRGSRGLDPDVGPGPGLPVGSISSPCG